MLATPPLTDSLVSDSNASFGKPVSDSNAPFDKLVNNNKKTPPSTDCSF